MACGLISGNKRYVSNIKKEQFGPVKSRNCRSKILKKPLDDMAASNYGQQSDLFVKMYMQLFTP